MIHSLWFSWMGVGVYGRYRTRTWWYLVPYSRPARLGGCRRASIGTVPVLVLEPCNGSTEGNRSDVSFPVIGFQGGVTLSRGLQEVPYPYLVVPGIIQ